ncbi:MAG: alpha/beta fold hydrolase [Bacteroidetes bacterium]|nr:alpha/beta fold hydrolase [Bacteroidota bacterium]
MPTPQAPRIPRKYQWMSNGTPVAVPYERFGEGPPLLLLPALSTISSREELREVANRLATSYTVTLTDWPGFGGSNRPLLRYRRGLYQRFLLSFVRKFFDEPPAVLAAGHAAGITVRLASRAPALFSHFVLAAPTWRGPLPSALGGKRPAWLALMKWLIEQPVIGPALYRLNVSRGMIEKMAKQHVFANPAMVTPQWLDAKEALTQDADARYATAAFITGALDPAHSREEFLGYLRAIGVPTLLLIGEDTPERSLAEMDAMAAVEGVAHQRVPGSIGLHEEHPSLVAEAVRGFVSAPVPA